MPPLVIGLNHTTAPVSIRERVTFGPDIVVGALRSLAALPGVDEAVILSTCNRTEIYCSAGDSVDDPQAEWLAVRDRIFSAAPWFRSSVATVQLETPRLAP